MDVLRQLAIEAFTRRPNVVEEEVAFDRFCLSFNKHRHSQA